MAKKEDTTALEAVNVIEQEAKKEEKWVKYYYDNIFEDEEHITMIADTANEVMRERFHITIPDYRMTTSAFLRIFESFIEKLKVLEKEYDDFQINLANRLLIGFTNNENDDDEKSGNFMFFMKHLREAPKVESINDPTVSNLEKLVQWNTENVVQQPELIRALSIEAIKFLRSIDIQLANAEIIMPLFVTYYESIINYLKIHRREEDLFELEINFVKFKISAREAEDGRDTIIIKPTVESKLDLKSDASASSKSE